MTNRRIKKSVVYGAYVFGLLLLIGLIYVTESMVSSKKNFNKQENNYVTKTIFDDVIPVIKVEDKLVKPFMADDVKELTKYYDYKSDEKNQQESIINFENTYMQSSGISYGKDAIFDVVSVLPGTIEEIKSDDILGKVIKVKHDDKLYSIYSCLGETTISKGDRVIAGQVIGQSGTCNINKDIKNHVYFELQVDNNLVNPNNYYGKTLNEIRG